MSKICSAQAGQIEIGVQFQPGSTFNSLYNTGMNFGFTSGVFYQYKITDQISLGTGIDYQYLKLQSLQFVIDDPLSSFIQSRPRTDRFDIMRYPFWLEIDLRPKERSVQLEWLAGLAYGAILNHQHAEEEYQIPDLNRGLFFAFTGLEVGIPIQHKYKFSFGVQCDFMNIYNSRYGRITNPKLQLRFSRIINADTN